MPTQTTALTQTGNVTSTTSTITVSNGAVGTGTVTLANYIPVTNSSWTVLSNFWKPKCFRLGDTKVCIYNCDNKYFMVDNVHFSFEVKGTNVNLKISTYGTTTLNSLDEVKNFIKSIKVYYRKCKEFEKQLELSSDFS